MQKKTDSCRPLSSSLLLVRSPKPWEQSQGKPAANKSNGKAGKTASGCLRVKVLGLAVNKSLAVSKSPPNNTSGWIFTNEIAYLIVQFIDSC